MPKFVMENTLDCVKRESSFVYGFIEVMFFTNQSCYSSEEFFTPEAQSAIEEGQADGVLPNDIGYGDIDADSLVAIRAFCEAWQTKHAALIAEVLDACPDYDESQLGRDFHYTHCGHGVGFNDRDALNVPSDQAEYDRITAMMRAEGTTPGEWSKLLSKANALKPDYSKRLSDAAGYGEINPWFDESGKVHVDMY